MVDAARGVIPRHTARPGSIPPIRPARGASLRPPGLLAAALLLALLAPLQAVGAQHPAPGFSIGLPIACTPGYDCFIQNYVDRDPGPGARDYDCGRRTNNGHKGTDFRVPDLMAMRRGVAVLAVAPGRVLRTRDGVPDINVRYVGPAAVAGRECGNGVVVAHRDGWQTQYCHMRRGSIAVAPGETVEAGQKLGLVGLSGKTEFPHVHLSVRRRGRVVDPFVGPSPSPGCGVPRAPLWRPDLAGPLSYRPTELVRIGFAAEPPVRAAVLLGRHRARVLPADAPVLSFWVLAIGLQRGDRIVMRMTGPDGATLAESRTRPLPRAKAEGFTRVMKRRRAGPWPAGTYRGEYRIERRGGGATRVVLETVREVLVR